MRTDEPLKIHVNDIRDDGLQIEEKIDEQSIGLTKDDPLHFISPLDVHVELQRIEDMVLSNVKVHSKFESYCYRSLKKVEQEWEEKFNLQFDLNEDTDYIDLAEEIRQEVILRIPMRVLSEEEKKNKKVAPVEPPPEVSSTYERTTEESKTYKPFENLKDISEE